MDLGQFIIIACVIALSSALQAAIGFGAGLFAIPIMVWVGIPLPQAVIVIMVVVAAQNGWGAWQHRRDICMRSIGLISAVRIAALPVGVALMGIVVTLGQDVVKRWVGIGLLLTLALMTSLRISPQPRIHPAWTVFAGTSSGIFGGLLGMGGPPLVLWVMAHDWTADQARATLWAIFTIAMPALVIAMVWRFGEQVVIAAAIGVLATPLAIASAVLSVRLTRNLSIRWLRRISFAVLIGIALNLIVQSL